MTRGDWRARLAFPRLGKALMLFIAVQLMVTAWTGVMAAPDGPQEEVPAAFSEPQVRAGDRAVYAVQAGSGDDRPTVDGRPLVAVAVHWSEPRWAITSDGSFRWTMPMEIHLDLEEPDRASDRRFADPEPVDGRSDDEPSRASSSYDVTLSVAYDTERWVSTGTARTLWKDHVDRYASAGNRTIRDSADKRTWRVDLSDPSTPCGFHLGFHGGSTDLAAPLDRVGDCSEADALEAAAVDAVAGTQALRLASQGDASTRVWYAPEVPVPVRWIGPLEDLAVPQDGRARLELSEWQRGDGPTPDAPHEDEPAPKEIQTAQAKPWGPAEREMRNVSFRLSEAYRVLTTRDDTVRSFLQDHPDAYTARAWMYRDRDPARRPRTTWQIILTDGDDHVERFVVRSDPVELPGTDREVAPPAEVVTRDDAPVDAPRPDDRYPAPADRPDRLPVVGDGTIRSTGDAGYAPWETGAAGHYGLSTSCRDGDCSDPRTVVEVGTTMAPLLGTPGPKAPWATNRSAVRLGFTPDGDFAYIEGTGKVGTGPTVAEDDGSDQAPPPPAATIDAAPWTFPAREAAAGISVAALLVGALYYLWPKVKVLGAGFYSRIGTDPDEVLDNDVRRSIHEMVQAEPGIHFREIKRRLDTGVGVLEHHLEKLLAADLLVESRTAAYRCYFPYGTVDRTVMDVAGRLRSTSARRILQAILERPGRSVSDVADVVAVSRSTVSYHLDRLDEAGVVDQVREGRRLAIRPTDLGREAAEALGLT